MSVHAGSFATAEISIPRSGGLSFAKAMGPEELFRENLQLIGRIVDRVCRNARLFGADAEDLASAFRVHLMDDDYAVLRRFEGRCSLVTYLTIVAQRFLGQDRIRTWGRWYESTAARRLGELGLRAEQLIRRDGRTVDEALPILRDLDPSLTRERLESIVRELPQRAAHIRLVAADEVEDELFARTTSEERVVERDVRALSGKASEAIRNTLASLPLEDRTLVLLHFRTSMTIADISRALGVAQRPLYRRLERILGRLREALREAGLDRSSINDLVGSKLVEFDFGMQTTGDRA